MRIIIRTRHVRDSWLIQHHKQPFSFAEDGVRPAAYTIERKCYYLVMSIFVIGCAATAAVTMAGIFSWGTRTLATDGHRMNRVIRFVIRSGASPQYPTSVLLQ